MFRFENNMPEYLENESRDFQMMTRLDDLLFMGQRADIATIQNLNSTKKCKDTFLHLLAKKVGFFTNEYIEEDVLRNILGAFRLAVKHKGTKLGIFYAVTAILKSENTDKEPIIFIDSGENASIDILTPINIKNKVALNEFLRYVVPAGFIVNIKSYPGYVTKESEQYESKISAKYTTDSFKALSQVRTLESEEFDTTSWTSDDTYMKNRYIGSIALGTVWKPES